MNSPRTVVDQLLVALDARDATGIGAVLAEDAVLVDEVTRGWYRGRPAIAASLEATFGLVDSITSKISDVHVREWPDAALVTCTLDQKYVMGGTEVTVVAPTSIVLDRRGGDWSIVSMHSVPIYEG